MLDHTCKRAGIVFGTLRRVCEKYLLNRVQKKWETANRERKEWKWEQTFIYTLPMYFYYPFIFLFPFFISRCPFPVSFSPFPDPRLSNIYRRPVIKPVWQWIEIKARENAILACRNSSFSSQLHAQSEYS